MKTASKARLRSAAFAALACTALLGATGCQAVNDQATTMQYDPSDGVAADVGAIELRNIFIASAAEGEPGRIGGALFNTSDTDATVTMRTADGSEAEVELAPNQNFYLEQEPPLLLEDVSEQPGSLAPMTITDGSTGTSYEAQIPVVDGTLPEYRSLVPGDSASPARDLGEANTGSNSDSGH